MNKTILIITLILTSVNLFGQKYKCIPFERFSKWEQSKEAVSDSLLIVAYNPFHVHNWVYEELGDGYQNKALEHSSIYGNCGYSITITENRICNKCLLHESRKVSKGKEEIKVWTEYDKLIKQYYPNRFYLGEYSFSIDCLAVFRDSIILDSTKTNDFNLNPFLLKLPEDHR